MSININLLALVTICNINYHYNYFRILNTDGDLSLKNKSDTCIVKLSQNKLFSFTLHQSKPRTFAFTKALTIKINMQNHKQLCPLQYHNTYIYFASCAYLYPYIKSRDIIGTIEVLRKKKTTLLHPLFKIQDTST